MVKAKDPAESEELLLPLWKAKAHARAALRLSVIVMHG
jgi:hypothetical protein